ncbi:integral membrane protein (TIGR01906 family) [Acetoanaerobium pronyense]|uniref:Integral membrane protein (TIGR01906 family) n=1 Tax=Acetoanaerobium pronyense TaxID=1482736 RepID=A0ABS4KHG1_9FIRM|nr:TIGR01906 family membrane protein [Acetoanaerobium pronyense]MBP2026691.1 integral membrane protein (TIGR01906 family) [Acetoanaerobium pronyense]
MQRLRYLSIVLIVVYIIVFTSTEMFSVLRPVYFYEYNKYDIYSIEYVQMYPVDMVTNDVIFYLSGLTDNMNRRGFFGEREIVHMEDVKVLFRAGSAVRFYLIIVLAFLIKKSENQKDFSKRYRITYLSVVGGILALTGLIAMNFNRAFVIFHKLFFSNDYWILYPSESIIINLMPEGFFMDMAIYILVSFFILSLLVSYIIQKTLPQEKNI